MDSRTAECRFASSKQELQAIIYNTSHTLTFTKKYFIPLSQDCLPTTVNKSASLHLMPHHLVPHLFTRLTWWTSSRFPSCVPCLPSCILRLVLHPTSRPASHTYLTSYLPTLSRPQTTFLPAHSRPPTQHAQMERTHRTDIQSQTYKAKHKVKYKPSSTQLYIPVN